MITSNGPVIGDLIRARREAARLSQEDVAAQAGISISTMSSMERGLHPATARNLAAVAHTLGITADELRECGRPDAAAILVQIIKPAASRTAADAAEYLSQRAVDDHTPDKSYEVLFNAIQALMGLGWSVEWKQVRRGHIQIDLRQDPVRRSGGVQ